MGLFDFFKKRKKNIENKRPPIPERKEPSVSRRPMPNPRWEKVAKRIIDSRPVQRPAVPRRPFVRRPAVNRRKGYEDINEKDLSMGQLTASSALVLNDLSTTDFGVDSNDKVYVLTGGITGVTPQDIYDNTIDSQTITRDFDATSGKVEFAPVNPFDPTQYIVKSLIEGKNIKISNASGAHTIRLDDAIKVSGSAWFNLKETGDGYAYLFDNGNFMSFDTRNGNPISSPIISLQRLGGYFGESYSAGRIGFSWSNSTTNKTSVTAYSPGADSNTRSLTNKDRGTLDITDVISIYDLKDGSPVTYDHIYNWTDHEAIKINRNVWKVNDITGGTGIAAVNTNGNVAISLSGSTPSYAGPYNTTGDVPTPIDINMFYLIGASTPYDIYVYINNVWTLVGSTSVDLSDYYTKTEIDTTFAGYTVKALEAGTNITLTPDLSDPYKIKIDASSEGVTMGPEFSGDGTASNPYTLFSDISNPDIHEIDIQCGSMLQWTNSIQGIRNSSLTYADGVTYQSSEETSPGNWSSLGHTIINAGGVSIGGGSGDYITGTVRNDRIGVVNPYTHAEVYIKEGELFAGHIDGSGRRLKYDANSYNGGSEVPSFNDFSSSEFKLKANKIGLSGKFDAYVEGDFGTWYQRWVAACDLFGYTGTVSEFLAGPTKIVDVPYAFCFAHFIEWLTTTTEGGAFTFEFTYNKLTLEHRYSGYGEGFMNDCFGVGSNITSYPSDYGLIDGFAVGYFVGNTGEPTQWVANSELFIRNNNTWEIKPSYVIRNLSLYKSDDTQNPVATYSIHWDTDGTDMEIPAAYRRPYVLWFDITWHPENFANPEKDIVCYVESRHGDYYDEYIEAINQFVAQDGCGAFYGSSLSLNILTDAGRIVLRQDDDSYVLLGQTSSGGTGLYIEGDPRSATLDTYGLDINDGGSTYSTFASSYLSLRGSGVEDNMQATRNSIKLIDHRGDTIRGIFNGDYAGGKQIPCFDDFDPSQFIFDPNTKKIKSIGSTNIKLAIGAVLDGVAGLPPGRSYIRCSTDADVPFGWYISSVSCGYAQTATPDEDSSPNLSVSIAYDQSDISYYGLVRSENPTVSLVVYNNKTTSFPISLLNIFFTFIKQ